MSEAPVQYMARTRDYYAVQGFDVPYQWAHFEDVPFTPLRKSLSDSNVAVITTGAMYRRTESDPRFVDSAPIKPLPERLYGDDLSWDKKATHLDDVGSYLPVQALVELKSEGRIKNICSRFHCVPTEYSQRRTKEADAPEILKRCREDQADLALLVPL